MKSVLIIGSGIAGITAAYHLSKAGLKVTIVEATENSGGRLTALFDSKSGEMIDNGQHALMTAYHTFLEIIDACNAKHLFNFQKNLEVIYYDTNQNKSRLFTGYLDGKPGFLLAFLLLRGISFKSKFNILKLILFVENSDNFEKYKEYSTYNFLTELNQTEEAITRFWEPFIVATMNCSIKEAAATIFINILKRAFIDDLDNSKLILPAIDLRLIIDRVIEQIKYNNAEIIFSAKINNLLIENGKIIGAEDTKGVQYFADYVISSLPPYALKKIIPIQYLEKFSELDNIKYSPIVSVYIWTAKELFEEDFIAALGTEIQWLFNRNKIIRYGLGDKFKHSYSITTSSAEKFTKMKQSEVIEYVAADIKKLFPSFEKEEILHYRIITEKFATFLANAETESIRPKSETSIPNFFLAGDWTDTKLPATIEGASLSGKTATEKILEMVLSN